MPLGKDRRSPWARPRQSPSISTRNSPRPWSRTSARRRCRRSSCKSSSFGGDLLPWPNGRPIGRHRAGGSSTSRSARRMARHPLVVDGQPMFLRGRIDRIDVQESSGKRMIFDYKTSDAGQVAGKAHRKKSGEWIDLQLPLYRHLVAAPGDRGPCGTGLHHLPKDISRVGAPAGRLDARKISKSADRAAAEVIRRVRAEEFWPPANPPPAFSEDFAAICQDDRFGAVIADEETEGGGNP